MASSLSWTAFPTGSSLPPDVIVVENRKDAPLLLARMTFKDGGVHPAVASEGIANTPYMGGIEQSGTFDVATGGQAVWVNQANWAQATPIGRQGPCETFLCRAPVRLGTLPVAWVYGKAYNSGLHANRAYVAFQDREFELLENFELLSIQPL